MKQLTTLLLAVLMFGFFSCEKQEQQNEEGTLVFSFSKTPELKTKSAIVDNEVSSAVISITKDGKAYKDFTLKSLNVSKWDNTNFTTQEIKLAIGKGYKIEHFSLKNKTGQTLYATPVKGSKFAANVSNPLAIEFEVKSGTTSKINLEVVSALNTTPDEFGYIYVHIGLPSKKGGQLIKKEKIFINKTEPGIVYEYFYKSNGNMDFYTLNKRNKFVCKYNDKNQLEEEVYSANSKNVYKYNAKGQKIEYTKGVKPNGNFYGKHVYEYENDKLRFDLYYNAKNKLVRRTIYTKIFWREDGEYKVVQDVDSNGDFKTKFYITIEKDNKGRVKKETKKVYDNSNIVSETIFHYSN